MKNNYQLTKGTLKRWSNNFLNRPLLSLSLIVALGFITTIQAQVTERTLPKLWFGFSAAANFNGYSGTTQRLNSSVIAPTAFHNGKGVSPFGSFLFEFTPNRILGFALNVGYESRNAKFDNVIAPCNCPATLKTNISYFTVEPSVRISPFSNGFHIFLGGRLALNQNHSFNYTQKQTPITEFNALEGDLSDMRKTLFSAQIGLGYDIPVSMSTNRNQTLLTPFVSYHPYFGQEPRSIESWSVQTIRIGLALKFGRGPAIVLTDVVKKPKENDTIVPVVANVKNGINFSIRAPLVVPVKRKINESFPLRNYVFFDKGSSAISSRYVKLSNANALAFKESQLQEVEPKDVTGRSGRQLAVYYNILNILGDRMRSNPKANITLIGASAGEGEELGKTYAESVKKYLVDIFGISAARITTEGRNQPIIPSEKPNSTGDLELLRAGDRRVDLVSNSAELLAPLYIKAIIANPMDSRIIIKAMPADKSPIQSWTVEIKDEKGIVSNYGPFYKDLESITASEILGERAQGDFKVVMIGKTKDGKLIRKDTTLKLIRNEAPKEEAMRFSILFDFDVDKTVSTYEKFIQNTIAPLVANNSTVIIHGHTDKIGDEDYNMVLSQERANNALEILKAALFKAGKTGITYEVYGFGSDTKTAPFDNSTPEERFYNRTVVIDIIAQK